MDNIVVIIIKFIMFVVYGILVILNISIKGFLIRLVFCYGSKFIIIDIVKMKKKRVC